MFNLFVKIIIKQTVAVHIIILFDQHNKFWMLFLDLQQQLFFIFFD
jgi:hypothetical protein